MILPRQLFCGLMPRPEKMEPVRNRADFHWKPTGGLWTSTLRDGSSDWREWTRDNSCKVTRSAWVLQPACTHALVISTPDDLDEAIKMHGRRDVPARIAPIRSLREMLDWEDVARHYDCVTVPNPHPWRLSDGLWFNVMDAECTIWFRWNFHGKPVELRRYLSVTRGGV